MKAFQYQCYYSDSYSSNDDDTLPPSPWSNREGIDAWAKWRRNLNSTMVEVMNKRQQIRHYVGNNGSSLRSQAYMYLQPNVAINRKLTSYVFNMAQFEESNVSLGYASFLSFGIPRVHLKSPASDTTLSMDSNSSAASYPETISSDAPKVAVRRRRYKKRHEV